MLTAALLLFLHMPTVTAYPIDLVNDPTPIIIGVDGEFDGPVKVGSALYCWGVLAGTGSLRVYKSTDNGATWAGQDTGSELHTFSAGPTLLDLPNNRLIVGNLSGGFFILQNFTFGTGGGWGSTYASGGLTNSAGAFQMFLLPSGNIRVIHRFSTGGTNRLYYSEYSPGSSSWVSLNSIVSNENTHNCGNVCSTIDSSGNIAVFHVNAFDGNVYYNSIAASGTVSAAVNMDSTFPNISGFGDLFNCVIDGSELKMFIDFTPGSWMLPTVVRGSAVLSPSWTSYGTDADAGDDIRTGLVWRDAASVLRETWADRGDHGSLAATHHFAEVTDGSTSPTYYDLSGFTSSTYVKSMSIGKDGYLLYLSNNHLYFVPPNVTTPKKRNVSYVGTASSMQSASNFSY